MASQRTIEKSNNSDSFNVNSRNTITYYATGDITFHENVTQNDIGELRHFLQPVFDASYTRSGTISNCVNGTREAIIGKITEWINQRDCPAICWLSGPAGFGKSAIAQTIAEQLAQKHQLAASFFFLRGAGDRSTIAHLIPTLAFQAAMTSEVFNADLIKIVRNGPRMDHQSLQYQFKHLLVGPFELRKDDSIIPVIIIDALDECNDKNLIAELIEVMIQASNQHQLPFKLFVTSRIEEHIQECMTSASDSGLKRLRLESYSAKRDIKKFLRGYFDNIRPKKRVLRAMDGPWPTRSDLIALVKQAEGSFAFASTVAKYVGESSLPNRVLQAVLQDPHNGLDDLYAQVLDDALAATDVSLHPIFIQLLGVIAILKKPLSIEALTMLLDTPQDVVVASLLGIQSIIAVPESDYEPVYIAHTSLRDFLMSKVRSATWYVDAPKIELHLAECCLRLMNRMEYDTISEALQYAGLNWIDHISATTTLANSTILLELQVFVSRGFYPWINVLISKHIYIDSPSISASHNRWENRVDGVEMMVIMEKAKMVRQ